MKFISWNINGANSVFNGGGLEAALKFFEADVLAFQETKVLKKDKRIVLPGWHDYWSFHKSSKSLHPQSGVMVQSRQPAKKWYDRFPEHPHFDTEGRLLVCDYDFFYLVNVYVPQTQDEVAARSDARSIERRNYRNTFDRLLREHVEALDEEKPVIICGDFNAAAGPLDMSANSRWQDGKGFAKNANVQLRKLLKTGFSDTFRVLHPEEKNAYTHFWLNDRDGTAGRRLDYFFVSSDLEKDVQEAEIYKDISGSDHYPIMLKLDMGQVKLRTVKIHNLTYEDLLERERLQIFYEDLGEVDLSHAWDTIDWKEVEARNIVRLKNIAEVAKTYDIDKIDDTQYWYVKKLDSKVLAVRETVRKKKHKGIDRERWVTSDQKMHAAIGLTSKFYHAKPSLIRDILDDFNKPRRINCDTYRDTAMQILYGASVAPVHEVWSDRKSFANRPGRNTSDADFYIKKIYSGEDAPLWIVKTDVKKCYESMDHDWLVKNVPMAKDVLIEFLKRSYYSDGRNYSVDRGIGLGSSISPMLANFAMDGLQDHIYHRLFGSFDDVPDEDNGNMVRFADDILVSARDNKSAVIIRHAIAEFLGERGLELSPEKTKIIYFPAEGFDYLGRHYEKSGDMVKSWPSEGAVTRFKRNIGDFILKHKWSPESIVEDMNKKLLEFATYHRMTDADEAFRDIDAYVCTTLLKLCDRYFGEEKKQEYLESYFHREKGGMRFFVKGAPHIRLMFLSEVPRIEYNPLRLDLNPFIDVVEFNERTSNREIANMTDIYGTIWKRQEGKCEYCGGLIQPDEVKEVIETDPTARRKVDRLSYIHSRCRHLYSPEDFEDSEYTEDQNTLRNLVDYMYEGVADETELEENLLYQFFKNTEGRTVSINIKEAGELYGTVIDKEVAKHTEYWLRLPGDRFGECWHRNGFYFNGFASVKCTSVVFRKVVYKGDEVRFRYPDIILNGRIKERTAAKLRDMSRHILMEDGYPTY